MLEFADFNWVWDHYTYRKDGNIQNTSTEMSVCQLGEQLSLPQPNAGVHAVISTHLLPL